MSDRPASFIRSVFTFFLWLFALGGLAVFALVFWLVWSLSGIEFAQAPKPLPERMMLRIDFAAPMPETGGASGLLDGGNPFVTPTRFQDVIRAIDKAADDPRIIGIYGRFGTTPLGIARAQEMHDAILRFRENSGKPTLAWATGFGELGRDNAGFLVASAFDQVRIQPLGMVGLTGAEAEFAFLADTLARFGLSPQVIRREEFKSAFDIFADNSLSEPNREQITAIIDDLDSQLARQIATARGLSSDQVRDAMARGPLRAEEAIDAGLIDGLAWQDEMQERLEALFPENVKAAAVSPARYLAGPAGPFGIPLNMQMDVDMAPDGREDAPAQMQMRGPGIAVITAEGAIVQSAQASPFGGEATIAADQLAAAIYELAELEGLAAAVLRIESPGGSAIASETVHRALVRLREGGVPVVVSMGDVAASGGYWIASAGDRIVAQPGTLTGSIGVIMAKMSAGELADRYDVTVERISNSPLAGTWSPFTEWDAEQRARLSGHIDAIYDAFISRVAAGRGMLTDDVREIAKGRVWTGEQALARGLVDRTGGLDAALEEARTLAGLAPDEGTVFDWPRPQSPVEAFIRMASGEDEVSMGNGWEHGPFPRITALLARIEAMLATADTARAGAAIAPAPETDIR